MPSVFVFDAYGTLFDVHAAVGRWRHEVGPQADRLSELWRVKQLEYSWVRSLLGRYENFWALTEAALDYAAARCGGLPGDLRARLLDAYAELDAYPDVRPALARLRGLGHRTAILSNGTDAMLRQAVASAGLAELLDACLSVDECRVYKTDPRAYALVERHFGTPPAEVNFVSSNRWDVAGATAFGFAAVWLNRTGLPDEYADLAPRRVIASLADLDA
jgi:2-haloacid dehalogenase